ncbi:hypothetical protein [Actinacidiphila acidipaludis]|uniref:Uncharacterized protein n=1 Tax=Actinacidiphila acidipaludis TaxID=2873382 RepID=A0ABS7QG89_9ACTN|nr:hypothetical protein [Streptomyces acidipaludis]MBY8882178.1 hypothetical protein [Streptomyces acidipaludis]
MDRELTALAEVGAAVVVSAMATDLWHAVKEGTLTVFRRMGGDRRRAVADQLDSNAAMVREADRPDEVRRALFGFWALELAAVLRQDPEARADLTRLVTGLEGGRTGPALVQTNTARDGGTVYAVQYGDQRVARDPE